VPLIAIRRQSRFEVVDGETRLLAALLAGSNLVPVLASEWELTESEKKLAALQANAMRHDMTDMEYARVYLQLMEENRWGQAELARRVNAKPAMISKRLAVFEKLPEDLKASIGEGDGLIPFTSAYQLARLADEGMIRDLAEKVRQGLLCRDSVVDEVAKRLGTTQKKAKPIKAKTANGILAMIPGMEFETVLADLAALVEAIKKCRHHGLPLAALPGLLKS
jgi:ParB/RepB/Spo0J family partition protein